MRMVLTVFLLLWSITAMSFEAVCGNGLIVKAVVEQKVEDIGFFRKHIMSESSPRVYGDVQVSNEGKELKLFSSKFLVITLSDGDILRAYLDSVESNVIDFAGEKIKGGQVRTYKFYWPTNKKAGQSINIKEFKCTSS